MPRRGFRNEDVVYRNPKARTDGELYARPEPNPFTRSWEEGYDAGAEGRDCNPSGTKIDVIRYIDGYEAGAADRIEVDSIGSSNA